MEITGKLEKVLEAQSGQSARGDWKKQDFIIETDEQYPKKVCVSNWNDKVEIDKVSPGTMLNLSVNLESREFNGKWYTDVKVWKMEAVDENASPNQNATGDMPPPPPPPTAEDANREADNDEVGDLPF